jgi:hypothetical protein
MERKRDDKWVKKCQGLKWIGEQDAD